MRKTGMMMLLLCVSAFGLWTLVQAGTVGGTIYHDANRSSYSFYDQEIDAHDVMLPGIEVNLLDGAGEQTAYTDVDGNFIFPDLEPGSFLLDVVFDRSYQCTTDNHPRRAADAVREGAIHIVSIGDSIG